jgi:hypothetical protein
MRRRIHFKKRPGKIYFYVLLLLLCAAASVRYAEANCRFGGTSCYNDAGCWSGGKNTSVPSDCKCCTGFPYLREGECHR